MGGSHSKNSFFKKPKKYRPAESEDKSFWYYSDGVWQLGMSLTTSSQFVAMYQVQFIYKVVFAHKWKPWREKLVIRGVGTLDGPDSVHDVYYQCSGNKPTYDQVSFQAIAHVLLHGRIRTFNFYDDIFGKSKEIDVNGQEISVPMKAVTERASLLAIEIEKDKLSQKQKLYLNEFLQILHGVPIQLQDKNLKGILKLATKYKVLIVKRYCEHQLIWRDDFEFSRKREFKMACKYNLNILMNQLLRKVKTVKKLAKLASIAIEMESMDTNISKLLITKMYQIS